MMLPLAQFKEFVAKHQLFYQGDKVLLAVSGGKDSVLMAHLFKLAEVKFGIAHCNFNLRGDEAQRDEIFVKNLAEKLSASFHQITFDTKAHAKQHHVSTQMAARTLRYQWFDELLNTHNYACVALAQHQNDVVETMLINLVRGTGIRGLHGILPKRAHYIRPLLFLTRAEIDELITQLSIDFVEDSSNKQSEYARNHLRLNVVPHLKALNPKLENTFLENATRFAQTERLLQLTVAQQKAKLLTQQNGYFTLKIKAVEALDPQFLLFFELLKPFGFTSDVCAEVLQNMHRQSGTSFYSESHQLTIDRTMLMITEKTIESRETHVLINAGETEIHFIDKKIKITPQQHGSFTPAKNQIYVDAEKLIFPLTCRNKQNGDKFMPFGMQNFKRLSDFLISQKIPLIQKNQIPLLINGNGEIMWVVGMRQDDRYKVSVSTKKIIIFELLN